uniref:F-box domain-containing protein n=1 Tax=Psilocybe cubensis TaxID=181762 RepID=A0A8H7XVH0_PSICU
MDYQAAYAVVNDDMSATEAFRIIDAEVTKHKNFILSLRTRRNTFSPISRLPPELLSRIFGFLSQDSPLYGTTVLSWIRVSYVCRTWRSVALNHPSLWSTLPLGYCRWTKEMLNRSKMASLTVKCDFSAAGSYSRKLRESTTLALAQSSRISNLSLTNADHPTMQKFLSEMPKLTPRLESIRLTVMRKSIDPALEPGCELPLEFLSSADYLRRIELTRFIINWESLVSQNLTHVKIHDVPPSARPTVTILWKALQKMPLLELLELSNVLTDGDTDTLLFSDVSSIHLPHLRILSLVATTPQVSNILRYLSFPQTAHIHIDCKGTHTTKFDFSDITSWASTFLAAPKKARGPMIRTFEVRSSYPTPGLRFRAFSEVLSDSDFTKSGLDPIFNLTLTSGFITDISVAEIDKMLVDVFIAMPLHGTVALRLDQNYHSMSSSALTNTFGTLNQLRSVTASGIVTEFLVKALGDILPNRRSTRSHHAQATFPALRSVSLCNVDLEFEVPLKSLEDALKARKKRGVEVRELKLEMCSRITQVDVSGLQRIVPAVKWDENELGFTDEEEEEDYYYDEYAYEFDIYDSDGYDFFPF